MDAQNSVFVLTAPYLALEDLAALSSATALDVSRLLATWVAVGTPASDTEQMAHVIESLMSQQAMKIIARNDVISVLDTSGPRTGLIAAVQQ